MRLERDPPADRSREIRENWFLRSATVAVFVMVEVS